MPDDSVRLTRAWAGTALRAAPAGASRFAQPVRTAELHPSCDDGLPSPRNRGFDSVIGDDCIDLWQAATTRSTSLIEPEASGSRPRG